jgi:hypothetical protein
LLKGISLNHLIELVHLKFGKKNKPGGGSLKKLKQRHIGEHGASSSFYKSVFLLILLNSLSVLLI